MSINKHACSRPVIRKKPSQNRYSEKFPCEQTFSQLDLWSASASGDFDAMEYPAVCVPFVSIELTVLLLLLFSSMYCSLDLTHKKFDTFVSWKYSKI